MLDHAEWVQDLDGDGHNEVVAAAGHMGGTRQAYLIFDGRSGELRAEIKFITGDFASRGNCGAYIPGELGKQILIVTSMRQSPSGPPPSNGTVELWSFDGKSARRRWSWSPTEYQLKYQTVLLGDLNGDGRMHAVIQSWCDVWNIDLGTGTVVSHTNWDPKGSNQRHYGWNELADVDGDGRLDLVNVVLTKHVDVLRNVGGKLELAWTHGWPDTVTTESRSLTWPFAPAADLDGDGRMEVMAALFDTTADKRWHFKIWDGVTGEQRIDELDLVPIDSVPLWGTNAGRAILCVRSGTLEVKRTGACEAWRWHDAKFEKIWSSPQTPVLLESATSDERRFFAFSAVSNQRAVNADVDGDGRVEFFTTDAERSGQSQAWGIDAEGKLVKKSGTPPAPVVRPLPPKLPALNGSTVLYLLAADIDGDGRNEILLYDNANLTVLRMEKDVLQTVESFPSTEIPIVGDLLGSGKPCVLTAGRGPDGNLFVRARGPDRKDVWNRIFPNSGPCGQYSERPHYMAVGHFTGGKHLDVFTYSTKPAARTYLLDGRTGEPVWQREEVPKIERHFQAFGGRASACDFNNDGAEDVLFCNPDFYCIANGRTGDLLAGPINLVELCKFWTAYASPTVLPREGASPIIYLGGAYASRYSIALEGRPSLWTEYLTTEHWPLMVGGEKFVEGLLPPSKDRGWRVGQIEADGTFICFDAATGRHLWRMPLPTAPSGIITGDVDGDGEAEFLFGGRDGKLLAIRDAGDRGEIVWSRSFDAPVGTPILADVNGDGRSEIIVSVGDGHVYVLGPGHN